MSITGTLVHIYAVARGFLYGQFQEHGGGIFRFSDWFGVGWEAQISMTTLGKKFSHYFVALRLPLHEKRNRRQEHRRSASVA